MKEERHFIEKRIWFSKWYKWIALILFILLLLCILPKCCSNFDQNKSKGNNSSVSNDTISFHIDPHQRRIIDPDKIENIPDDPFNRDVVNDLVNVYLNDTINIKNFYAETRDKLSNYNLIPTDTAEAYKRIQFRVDIPDKEEIMLALRKDTVNVKFVTNEWIYQKATIPNDPDFSNPKNQWFYEKTGVFEAWDYTKGDASIKIAVLDDGFDLNHNELKNNFTKPWNVIHYNDRVYANKDYLFHGTHVAGSIVAAADNNFGISGVAPNCTFIPVQISDESGYITISSLLDGVFYALKNKADIINLSIALSLGQNSKALNKNQQNFIREHYLKDEERLWDEVFEIAKNSNTIIVQAAGNDNILAGLDPMKRNKNSIIVGALDSNLELTSFTNYGNDVDVYAPGFQIYSSLPENNMGYLDGTSMASPIVAGSIALIKSYRPDLNPAEIFELIHTSTSKSKNHLLDLSLIFNDLL